METFFFIAVNVITLVLCVSMASREKPFVTAWLSGLPALLLLSEAPLTSPDPSTFDQPQ